MAVKNCPKCKGVIDRISVNKHSGMRIGHCSACGKLVNLGKADKGENKQTADGKADQGGKPADRKAGKPAGAGRKAAASARPGASGKPAGDDGKPGRSVQSGGGVPKPAGWRDALRSFFELD